MTSDEISKNRRQLTSLTTAAFAGNAAEVARLIPLSGPTPLKNDALCLAAQKGHTECVKLLMAVSTHVVVSEHFSPLRKAAENGHVECVKLLLSVAEEDCIYKALCDAVRLKHTECVKVLMVACDVQYRRSLPLQLAAQYNPECIDLLYHLSNPFEAVKGLKIRNPNDTSWIVLDQYIEAERLRGVLAKEVGEGVPDRTHKM